MSGRTRCSREGCSEPVEGPRRRFCAPHRQEHAQHLIRQLTNIRRAAGDANAEQGKP